VNNLLVLILSIPPLIGWQTPFEKSELSLGSGENGSLAIYIHSQIGPSHSVG